MISCSLRLGNVLVLCKSSDFFSPMEKPINPALVVYLVWPSEATLRQLHPTTEARYRPATRCVSSCLCVRARLCVWPRVPSTPSSLSAWRLPGQSAVLSARRWVLREDERKLNRRIPRSSGLLRSAVRSVISEAADLVLGDVEHR